VSDSTLDQIGVAAVIIVGFTFVALAIWGILHMAKKGAKAGGKFVRDNPELVGAAVKAAPLLLI